MGYFPTYFATTKFSLPLTTAIDMHLQDAMIRFIYSEHFDQSLKHSLCAVHKLQKRRSWVTSELHVVSSHDHLKQFSPITMYDIGLFISC